MCGAIMHVRDRPKADIGEIVDHQSTGPVLRSFCAARRSQSSAKHQSSRVGLGTYLQFASSVQKTKPPTSKYMEAIMTRAEEYRHLAEHVRARARSEESRSVATG